MQFLVESLEDRRCLAGSVNVVVHGDSILILGDNNDNAVNIGLDSQNRVVVSEVSGLPTSIRGGNTGIRNGAIDNIRVIMRGGDDFVRVNRSLEILGKLSINTSSGVDFVEVNRFENEERISTSMGRESDNVSMPDTSILKRLTIATGAGDDTVVLRGGDHPAHGWTVDAGKGVDLISGEIAAVELRNAELQFHERRSVLRVEANSSSNIVRIHSADEAGVAVTYDATLRHVSAHVEFLEVHGGAGHDILHNSTALPSTLRGGAGNDLILGGAASDQLYGDGGRDRLHGGDAEDSLWGGSGNDELFGGQGSDNLNGENGCDILLGGEGDDWLYGNSGSDILKGMEGDDRLVGHRGDDILEGGDGSDMYVFGRANTGDGEQRPTRFRNDAPLGHDLIVPDAQGVNSLDFTEYPGPIIVDLAKARKRQKIARSLSLTIGGTTTIHNVYGSEFDDFVTGNSQDNFLMGNRGSDRLLGRLGNDILEGGAGNDLLDGGAGDDRYVFAGQGPLGNDQVIDDVSAESQQDRGVNMLDFSTFGGAINVDISIAKQMQHVHHDLAIEINSDDAIVDVMGSQFDDTIIGNTLDNKLYGNSGNDLMIGGEGNDRLFGGQGDDELRGGEGNDFISGQYGDDAAFGNAGDDELFGGAGRDVLVGGDGKDTLFGDGDEDILEGGKHDDALFAGDGDDYADGGEGNDSIRGGEGNDLMRGGVGDDELHGEAGNDYLYGEQGIDSIHGGMGMDILRGGGVATYYTEVRERISSLATRTPTSYRAKATSIFCSAAMAPTLFLPVTEMPTSE